MYRGAGADNVLRRAGYEYTCGQTRARKSAGAFVSGQLSDCGLCGPVYCICTRSEAAGGSAAGQRHMLYGCRVGLCDTAFAQDESQVSYRVAAGGGERLKRSVFIHAHCYSDDSAGGREHERRKRRSDADAPDSRRCGGRRDHGVCADTDDTKAASQGSASHGGTDTRRGTDNLRRCGRTVGQRISGGISGRHRHRQQPYT